MILTYYGKQFFRMQYGDMVLALNPIGKKSGGVGGRFGADIVLVTTDHDDYNGVETVTYGEKVPFVVNGSGSYEVKGVTIEGRAVSTEKDKKVLINTVYYFTLDGISVCFLGHLSAPDLPADVREEIEDVDLVFVPVEGNGKLTPAQAYKLAVSLEPHAIVPMEHDGADAKNALKTFLKEGGDEKVKATDKVTLKKKDLMSLEGDIILLERHM
jgi:L-ascorbate metabolism protein UlaG (beta-lactamase superfamily)